MQRFRQSDLDKVRMFLEETAAPCDLARFSSHILPAVQRLVPGDVICLSETDLAEQKSVTFDVHPAGSHIDVEAFDRYMFDHPVFQLWDRVPGNPTARTSEVVSMQSWHRSNLYQEVYRRLGLEDSLAVALPSRGDLVSCICIERGGSFSERERALLDMVRPYIAQLYRNAEFYSLLCQSSRDGGVENMLLDSAGHPQVASAGAFELLERYFQGPVDPTLGLPSAICSWLRQQLSRYSAENEVPRAPEPLRVCLDGGSSLTLRLAAGVRTGEQSLLLLREERPGLQEIAPELDLSQRERDVLALARRGLRNAEIAAELQISPRTVEKHLENVYCKLGVENRVAAVDKAFRG